MKHDPAFPTSNDLTAGLTKRELFAAMAMQGILADPTVNANDENFSDLAANVANEAVAFADALIAELSK